MPKLYQIIMSAAPLVMYRTARLDPAISALANGKRNSGKAAPYSAPQAAKSKPHHLSLEDQCKSSKKARRVFSFAHIALSEHVAFPTLLSLERCPSGLPLATSSL